MLDIVYDNSKEEVDTIQDANDYNDIASNSVDIDENEDNENTLKTTEIPRRRPTTKSYFPIQTIKAIKAPTQFQKSFDTETKTLTSPTTTTTEDTRIYFPTKTSRKICDTVLEDHFISWGGGRLNGVPDFILTRSPEDCKNQCLKRIKCVAWNFSPLFGCNLKARIFNEFSSSGWYSGKKFC